MVIGGNTGYYFFLRSAKLKTYGTLHKAMWFHMAKRRAERQGLLLHIYSVQENLFHPTLTLPQTARNERDLSHV